MRVRLLPLRSTSPRFADGDNNGSIDFAEFVAMFDEQSGAAEQFDAKAQSRKHEREKAAARREREARCFFSLY